MPNIKTYDEIVISIKHLQMQIWTDLNKSCMATINQLEKEMKTGKIKPCREAAVCIDIWKEYQKLHPVMRTTPTAEWATELTEMLVMCNEIPGFYARRER